MGFTGKLKRSKQEQHGVSMTKFRVHDPRPTQTFQDGLRFVMYLKRQFANEPDKYDEIMATMHQFKTGRLIHYRRRADLPSFKDTRQSCKYPRIRTAVVVERVKVLLDGHPDLIRHFNQFLPWGYIRAHGPVGRMCV